jgi:hypothetical protein
MEKTRKGANHGPVRERNTARTRAQTAMTTRAIAQTNQQKDRQNAGNADQMGQVPVPGTNNAPRRLSRRARGGTLGTHSVISGMDSSPTR